MLNHLKGIHPTIHIAASDPCDQPSISSFVTKKSCSKDRSTHITELIAEMVAVDMLPIRFVEGRGFTKLLSCIEPSYKIPCRKTISTYIDSLYDNETVALHNELQKAQSVSICTDGWTSVAQDGCIIYTVHYMKENWSLCTHVLSTHAVEGRKTADALKTDLSAICNRNNWNLSGKVVAVIHENASNVVDVRESENSTDIGCAVHTLQLAIQAGLKLDVIEKLLSYGSRLVSHFRHSPLATSTLRQKQSELNTEQHSLKQYVKTRWNSSFEMIDRLAEHRWPVTAVLCDEKYPKQADARNMKLKDDQWSLIDELLPVLKALQVATTVMSSKIAPSSSVYPILYGLATTHLTPSDDDAVVVSRFKETVKNDIIRRFRLDSEEIDGGQLLLVIASFFDPRYEQLSFVKSSVKNTVLSKIINELRQEPANRNNQNEGDEEVALSSKRKASQDGEPSPKRQKDTALSFLLGQGTSTQEKKNDGEKELACYLIELLVATDEDPLDWWRNNAQHLPQLSSRAAKYLAIPAASVAAERIFSTAGHIISHSRSSLEPETADKLIFLS